MAKKKIKVVEEVEEVKEVKEPQNGDNITFHQEYTHPLNKLPSLND